MGVRGGRAFISTEIRSGKNGEGPTFDHNCRTLLAATYLRPLRDAERELSSGRNSRLSMVLNALDGIKEGEIFDVSKDRLDSFDAEKIGKLGLLGLGDYFNKLIEKHPHIIKGKTKVDNHLDAMQLYGDEFSSAISVSSSRSDDLRLRQLLEKLTLSITSASGRMGLGSNNILFMACELLLLADEHECLPLLLIEEPEAHIHAQRQLRLMQYLQKTIDETPADAQKPQIIITTHSPNLASEINLKNLVIIQSGKAFGLAEDETKLESNDYRFLQRFLDATKANLFFSRGLIIVEGDAENILLPTIARLIQKDFTTHGVSIVNVGGIGLRRYAKIFMRKNTALHGEISIPIACVTDLDVMPDCGPEIINKVEAGKDWPPISGKGARKWKAKKDFTDESLTAFKKDIVDKANEQCVRSFVAEEWTLEYSLAYFNSNILAKQVFTAAKLAIWDENDSYKEESYAQKLVIAEDEYAILNQNAKDLATQRGWNEAEVLASKVYAQFATGSKASKSIAAQYLAKIFEDEFKETELDSVRKIFPEYLVHAIDYVSGGRSKVSSNNA